jgi:4-amino-4-deoxy-L-arabinose transferase-like glycosyltransferase
VALGSRTLWYDEAFAVLFSEKGLNSMLYGTLTPVAGVAADIHPLLYYTTLNGWMRLFGQSAAAVRLYSVLLGVLTVGMVYLLTRDLFGAERTGLTTALITAIAPFHVQYSQEARMYALLGLLLIATTWCFVRGWRTGKVGYWLGFGVLAGLSMYTQQLAAFYLAALGLLPILMRRRDLLIRVALSAVLALLLYLPWFINLPSQLGRIGSYWIERPDAAKLFTTLWAFVFVELEARSPLVTILTTLTLTILVVFLCYRALPTLLRRDRDRGPLALVLWLFAAPIALLWLVSQWRPVYLTRALLPSGLILYIALAWLLTRARLPRPILVIITLPWLATIGLGLYTHYTWQTFPRPPFDAAVAYLAAQVQDGDQVVHANKITMLPMAYYARFESRTISQRYLRDVPGSGEDTLARPTQEVLNLLADECLPLAAKGSNRVWFVIFQRQIDQVHGAIPDINWLDAHYRRVSIQPFNDLLLYRYDGPDETARQAQCKPNSQE